VESTSIQEDSRPMGRRRDEVMRRVLRTTRRVVEGEY
jgi:hypothetical protein